MYWQSGIAKFPIEIIYQMFMHPANEQKCFEALFRTKTRTFVCVPVLSIEHLTCILFVATSDEYTENIIYIYIMLYINEYFRWITFYLLDYIYFKISKFSHLFFLLSF